MKEEITCAWKHAEGCDDTEQYFRDSFSGLVEEYNSKHRCGITVGGFTSVPPKPTGTKNIKTVIP